jgi:hypothetical protein
VSSENNPCQKCGIREAEPDVNTLTDKNVMFALRKRIMKRRRVKILSHDPM